MDGPDRASPIGLVPIAPPATNSTTKPSPSESSNRRGSYRDRLTQRLRSDEQFSPAPAETASPSASSSVTTNAPPANEPAPPADTFKPETPASEESPDEPSPDDDSIELMFVTEARLLPVGPLEGIALIADGPVPEPSLPTAVGAAAPMEPIGGPVGLTTVLSRSAPTISVANVGPVEPVPVPTDVPAPVEPVEPTGMTVNLPRTGTDPVSSTALPTGAMPPSTDADIGAHVLASPTLEPRDGGSEFDAAADEAVATVPRTEAASVPTAPPVTNSVFLPIGEESTSRPPTEPELPAPAVPLRPTIESASPLGTPLVDSGDALLRASDDRPVDGVNPSDSQPDPFMPVSGSGPEPREPIRMANRELRTEIDPRQLIDRVAQGVRVAHESGRQLSVRLSPPELGMLQIDISSRDGVLTARLETQTDVARQTIAEHLPQLREALVHLGAAVERIDVQVAPQSRAEDRTGGERSGRNDQPARQQQERREQPTKDHPQPQGRPRTRHLRMDELNIRI